MELAARLEAHFQARSAPRKHYREPGPPLEPRSALPALNGYLGQLAARAMAAPSVLALRADLLEACVTKAPDPQGVLTLTAPTGTGKTLSMLAFALRHAVAHHLRRVVVVIPYLTIIEQTVATSARRPWPLPSANDAQARVIGGAPMEYLAHSENSQGQTQSLEQHLRATAELASGFARSWGGDRAAAVAGLLHDVGKVSGQFQRYVRGQAARGGDHSTLGAVEASRGCQLLCFPIAGHHAGLANASDLKARLRRPQLPEDLEALRQRAAPFLALAADAGGPALPGFVERDSAEADLFVRMLFSALVDADCLDTEQHRDPTRLVVRSEWDSLPNLWPCFRTAQEQLIAQAEPTKLNLLRCAIYRQCLRAAERPQGLFSLTVPTGGGKTRSSMGFALRHALRRGLGRVIVVIPYTSIIEESARVYRGLLGDRAVLEHHSAIEWEAAEDSDRALWELASENWDAPVVVSTSVQFFESLFSNRRSQCRKLHNIARSVVIIDEVQTIPTHVLQPTFQVLGSLVKHYGVTVVLSSATQLAYETLLDEDVDLSIEEIAEDPEGLFRELKRVHYEAGAGEGPAVMEWGAVAAAMQAGPQAMAVVNTRQDARALFQHLPGASRCHLSTNLCGAHRRGVLAEVRQRLREGQPCHLATTQLVEAGVDLDFPLVFRALGPLDRIVQAAGRCNREGRLAEGRVVVFEPAEGGMPRGSYQSGAETARVMLNEVPSPDLHDPETYRRYFRRLYHAVELDSKGIGRDRQRLLFETVACHYRVIEDETVPVVVPWRGGEGLLNAIEARAHELTRHDLRALQPYFANLQRWEHCEAVAAGWCRRIHPDLDLWRWEGRYDQDVGLRLEADDLPMLIV